MHKVPDQGPQRRNPHCGDPGALVSYLYNDGTPDELAAIAAHVEACDPCTRELAVLGDTREHLAGWAPPLVELDFTFPSEAASAESVSLRPHVPWWRQSTPVWMQAMAATLVFGAGLAVGITGRGVTPAAATNATAETGVSRDELAALEARIRADISRVSATQPVAAPVRVATHPEDGSHDALLRQMRTLLADSEEKQRGEMALRMAQVIRDGEIQRKVDMAKVQNELGQFQNSTVDQIREWRDLQNRVSLPGGPR